MLTDVLPYLRCPVCDGPLTAAPAADDVRALRCPRGHSFDVARQGYVHLGTGRLPHPGDSAEMVAARAAWLATGGYDFISTALAAAAGAPPAGGLVLDVGAGTGRHLAAVLAALPGSVGLAVDVSKPALRHAARAHPRAGAVLADVWGRLPVAEAAATVLLNVFAPRNGVEFRRVLRPDGTLLVVTPTAAHLAELVDRLDLLRVDPEKPGRISASLTPGFTPEAESIHSRRLTLTRTQVRDLIGMGPSARHADPAGLVADLPEPFAVTASVRLTRYRPAAP